ncbi:MAG: preprotein translocase subunit SecG [Gammaproteobacteria bacterium]|nr:preprotein translocase subunit SecG [Gammaproteobacteria bacterium]
MLHNLLNGIHVFLCIAIVALVLLQRGKGADAGAGFGSGASGTVFGARGSATFLSKSTAVVATLFFVTSLSLAYLAGRPSDAPRSIVEQVPLDQGVPAATPEPAPVAPATAPAPETAPVPAPAPAQQ